MVARVKTRLKNEQIQSFGSQDHPSFWESYGASYESFCSYCDPSDWTAITRAVARSIGAHRRKRHEVLTIVDVGTGTGETAQLVRGHLMSETEVGSAWIYVEPDKLLHRHLLRVATGQWQSHGVAQAYSSIDELVQNFDGNLATDCITFLHTSYHFSDFWKLIERVDRILAPNSRIAVLAMPQTSEFFMGTDDLLLPCCSDQIVDSCPEVYELLSRQSYRSRFFAEWCRRDRHGALERVYPFYTRRNISLDLFRELLYRQKNIMDFQDELLIFKRTR